MSKVLVVYHSQQYGNTKILAEALADGAREAGALVEMINTNDRRVNAEEFMAANAVAVGTPDYFSYPAGTIKAFFDDIYLWDQAGKSVKGKPAALFFSCGSGGKVKQPFEALAARFFKQIAETVEGSRPITDEARKRCFELGKELVSSLG